MVVEQTPGGPPSGRHARHNADIWTRGDFVGDYRSRELRPVESQILESHGAALSGRLLELGCGAGRLTGHLIDHARSVHGIDLSPAMVAYCRRTYPLGTFTEGDLRDLSAFKPQSLDVVLAPYNVLDVLDDGERRGVLDEIRRLLGSGGLLILSSHNRAYAPLISRPGRVQLSGPRTFARSLIGRRRRIRNHRRLLALQRNEPGYALLNDEAHDFALLHYYISPDAQALQLHEHGFELLEYLDLDGRRLTAGENAARCPELHYVARRMPAG
jgi:SAM-dependent methyltransferase